MASPGQGRTESRLGILAAGTRRREFVTGLLAALGPEIAFAQLRTYRIAVVHPSTPVTEMTETGPNLAYRVFFTELNHFGYLEGGNLRVERYSGEGHTERYGELARLVVQSNPEVILAASSRMVQHFKSATTGISIVGFMADPVGFGLVSSLSRPGGNVTGVVADAGLEIYGKRLDLLKQTVPKLSRVGFLISQELIAGPAMVAMRKAAEELGVTLIAPSLGSPITESEYRRVLSAMLQDGVQGLIVSDQAEHFTNRELIIELTNRYRLPMIWPYRQYQGFGALISYGVDVPSLYRILAAQIDQILRGARPSDIPVQQPAKFALTVNLKTANALGLTVPPTLLAQADEVIE